jgi:hypothetical protein
MIEIRWFLHGLTCRIQEESVIHRIQSPKDPAFPPVAVNTGTMSLYLRASAEHWAANRHPTTGRPKSL